MSGKSNDNSAKAEQKNDINDVSITIGSRRISGWMSLAITRSAENFPNNFSLTAADEFADDPKRQAVIPGLAGEQCLVYIGDDLVITGYVDRVAITTGPEQHVMTISGRGLCQDLVDCSADLTSADGIVGGTMSAPNTLTLAQQLCNAFKLKARSAVKDLGLPIHPFTVALGETPYEIIERVCRYSAYLVYEDENGALVLDRVGTESMASGFKMPGNVEAAQSMLSIDQRFSTYTVLWSSVNDYGEISSLLAHRGDAYDKGIIRNRPRIITMEGTGDLPDIGQLRANWEMTRRIGRSQAVSLTCDSWRDSDKKLWQVNKLVPIDMPAHKIVGAKWIIGNVTFRKDNGGTHADLVLMPPDAFAVQRANLQLWDREVADALPRGQTPAPASTTAVPTGSGVPPT